MSDVRQRAREAAEKALHGCGHHPGGPHLGAPSARDIADAIEAYFDERMRGEADPAAPWGTYPDDAKDTNYGRTCARCNAAIRAGGRYHHVCATTAVNAPSTDYDTGYAHGIRDTEEQRDALRARVAELEVVVRAADGVVLADSAHFNNCRYASTCERCIAIRAYRTAKIEVPHG